MSTALTIQQRELVIQRPDVKEAWRLQIEKDLESALEMDAFERASWRDVVEAIAIVLRRDYNQSQLMLDLLYKIDVVEGAVRSDLQSESEEDEYLRIARRIAEREAVKVIFRFQYAGKL